LPDSRMADYSDPISRGMPHVPPDLIQALEARFPARCPKISESDREIWTYVGSRSIVEWLAAIHKRQLDKSMGVK